MGNENNFGEMFVGILGGMMIHELAAIGKVSGVFQSLDSYDIGLSYSTPSSPSHNLLPKLQREKNSY